MGGAIDLLHSLVHQRVSASFTNDQIGPLHDDNLRKRRINREYSVVGNPYRYEERSVAGEFQRLSSVVCLQAGS